MKIVLVSFTSLNASGGVPRWNRDFKAGFPEGTVVHYSWDDVIRDCGDAPIPEWEKAKVLANWLRFKKKIDLDDIVIGDGFWADGYYPDRTVSVCHGNWSHTTADDVAKGIPPEFPHHHKAQLEFRKKHSSNGGRMVSVSMFIAHQCKIQWGFEIPVINNGIDLNKFRPLSYRVPRERPVIIHGVTNENKGFDHIKYLQKGLNADILLLDEAGKFFSLPKYQALSQADLVVIPSAHEGNSYFCLESLASNVPVAGYDVGLLFEALKVQTGFPGFIMDRNKRSPSCTLDGVVNNLEMIQKYGTYQAPREWVSYYSLEKFQRNWREYLKKEFEFAPV